MQDIEKLRKIASEVKEKFDSLPEELVQEQVLRNAPALRNAQLEIQGEIIRQKEEKIKAQRRDIEGKNKKILDQRETIKQKDGLIAAKEKKIAEQSKMLSRGEKDEDIDALKFAAKSKLDEIMSQYDAEHAALKTNFKGKVALRISEVITESMKAINGPESEATSHRKAWEGIIDNSLNAASDLGYILGTLESRDMEQSINDAKEALA